MIFEDWRKTGRKKRTGDGSSDEDLDRGLPQKPKPKPKPTRLSLIPNSLPLDFPQKLNYSQAHQVILSNFQSNRGYRVFCYNMTSNIRRGRKGEREGEGERNGNGNGKRKKEKEKGK